MVLSLCFSTLDSDHNNYKHIECLTHTSYIRPPKKHSNSDNDVTILASSPWLSKLDPKRPERCYNLNSPVLLV